MDQRETKFEAGKIILFSSGEYSDFGYCGHIVTLQDIDLSELVGIYQTSIGIGKRGYSSPSRFVAWLCAQQYVAEINATEFYLGGYELKL